MLVLAHSSLIDATYVSISIVRCFTCYKHCTRLLYP